MAPDMILMGMVKQAYSTHVYVNLPGRLVGKIPITNISRSYSNLVKTVLENQDLTTVRLLFQLSICIFLTDFLL